MQAWYEYLKDLETELGGGPVKRWLRSLAIDRFDACNLYLQAQDSFQVQWFEEHIRKRARDEFLNNTGKAIRIHLSLAGDPSSKEKKKDFVPDFEVRQDELDQKATLKHFFVSEKNQVIFKFFNELIDTYPMDAILNPVFLHGPSGSGKTHLLMACVEELRKKDLNVFFVKAQTFTNHVVEAIRFGNMDQFRKAYRSMDVLVVDDVHVFTKRGATQEEFFHTFNTLHTAGKLMIFGANAPPQKLSGIEPRLISRFEWGLTLHLEKPSTEDLKGILQNKAKLFSFPLKDKEIEFLLKTFTSSPKALYQALEAMILRSHLGTSLSVVLKDLIEIEQKRSINSEKIIREIAEHYGMKSSDLLGKSQSKDCALPRQMAMYFCRQILKLPYMKIGQIFARDHSTVMTSVKQIEKSMKKKEIASSVYEIRERLEDCSETL